MELTCPLHPAASFELFFSSDYGKILNCPVCGIKFLKNTFFQSVLKDTPSSDYYYADKDYEKYYYKEDEIKADKTLKFILNIKSKYANLQMNHLSSEPDLKNMESKNRPAALEIGPGIGLLSRRLKKYFEIDAVEKNKELHKKLLEAGLNSFCGDFDEFRTDKKYDLIIMSDVIEHSLNPLSFMEKAFGFLKKGGLIYIEAPNINSIYFKFAKKKWIGINPYHNFYFSLESLSALLDALYLKIIKKDTYEGELVSLDALKRFGFFYKPEALKTGETTDRSFLFLPPKLKQTLKKINSKKGVKLVFSALNLPFSFLLNKFYLGDQLRVLAVKS